MIYLIVMLWGGWHPLEIGTWLAPTVISSGIAGGVALATHFSAQGAKKSETREDIRTEAFDQAKAYYVDVIDRQEHDLLELRTQVAEALRRAGDAESAAETCRAAVRRLTAAVQEKDARIAELVAGR